jgi:hypothetical protein
MKLKYKISEYLVDIYGLERQPCSIPKNKFESNKMDFYLWVNKYISSHLFYFIRDKISPIKYLKESLDGYIGLILRNDKGVLINEILIRKHYYIDTDSEYYTLMIYDLSGSVQSYEILENNYKEMIDNFLSMINTFAPMVREKRINDVLL